MAIQDELGDFVGTPCDTHVFVLVADGAKFAKIKCPETDQGSMSDGRRLLTKRVEQQHGIAVIFHHWVAERSTSSSRIQE
jgi:hypothetical protein